MSTVTSTHEYQKFVAESAIFPKNLGVIYCALKLSGEAGEVTEKIGKLIRDSKAYQAPDEVYFLANTVETLINSGTVCHKLSPDQIATCCPKLFLTVDQRRDLLLELGDVAWYVTALAAELGATLNDVIARNVEKLTSRRERGKLGGSGDNR